MNYYYCLCIFNCMIPNVPVFQTAHCFSESLSVLILGWSLNWEVNDHPHLVYKTNSSQKSALM